MYSPKIAEPQVRVLYRLARARGVPMTRLVAEIIEAYLALQVEAPPDGAARPSDASGVVGRAA